MNEKVKRDLIRLSEAACEDAYGYICDSFGAIVQKFIDKAVEDASVPHAKFLMDFAGLMAPLTKQAEEEKSAKAGKQVKEPKNLEAEFSLAQLILDTLAAFDRGEWKVS